MAVDKVQEIDALLQEGHVASLAERHRGQQLTFTEYADEFTPAYDGWGEITRCEVTGRTGPAT